MLIEHFFFPLLCVSFSYPLPDYFLGCCFLLSPMPSLCILDINPLLVTCVTNIFQLVACLFILIMVSFGEQKILILMQANLTIISFMIFTLCLKKSFPPSGAYRYSLISSICFLQEDAPRLPPAGSLPSHAERTSFTALPLLCCSEQFIYIHPTGPGAGTFFHQVPVLQLFQCLAHSCLSSLWLLHFLPQIGRAHV